MIKRGIALFFMMGLVGCAEVMPFIDSRREAGQVQPIGQSTPDRIAVCYNPLWHNEEYVKKLADDACAANKKTAVYDDTKYFNCRLISPNTAFYRCR